MLVISDAVSGYVMANANKNTNAPHNLEVTLTPRCVFSRGVVVRLIHKYVFKTNVSLMYSLKLLQTIFFPSFLIQ